VVGLPRPPTLKPPIIKAKIPTPISAPLPTSFTYLKPGLPWDTDSPFRALTRMVLMKRILSTTAALSLSLAAVLGGAVGAQGHSDELQTSPEQGSTVEAGRIPIILTFGEELLVGDESISHEVVVTNEAGEILPALCASAEGFDLSTAAALDQPGTYTVTWRTVSADGHPVSGSFEFDLVNNTDYDAATDAVDACVSSSMAEPLVIAAPTDAADSSDSIGWLVAGGLVALGAAAAVSGRVLRAQGLRSKNKSE